MSSYLVPYTALAQQTATIKPQLLCAFEQVLDSGHYIQGRILKQFEERFADFCGARFAVGVANGTIALNLVWEVLGLGPGDEVITAPNSFIATASAIAMTGAKPVFVDIGSDLNIDPDRIEEAITPKTKGIVPVHLTGRPAQMPKINLIAQKHGLFVLEDAAQAVGARRDGRSVGSWGDAAGFSLHPLKNLFAYGDGGVITTSDESLREKLLQARNHGLRNREECSFWSGNNRLDELQAALVLVQMTALEDWTERRRSLAQRYNFSLQEVVRTPSEGPGEHCVYQTYIVQADYRDELHDFLRARGVEALVHYRTPIHMQPAAAQLGYTSMDFPRAAKASQRILSLPLFPTMTHAQQDIVITLIREFYANRRGNRTNDSGQLELIDKS